MGRGADCCLIALAIAAALVSASPCAAEWRPDDFMIALWGCPDTPELARAVVDAGFNTVICPAEQLELCREYGLKAIVRGATPEQARELRADSAVWGWFVQDEPKDPPSVADAVRAFHDADPDHAAYVNLTAWEDLGAYLSAVRPRVLSYDYYQWWWNPAHHFGRLEAHRRAALDADIPLICWVEANSDGRWEWGEAGQTRLADNPDKLRHSVYTALAYGVKGIQWFNAYVVFEAGPGRRMLPELRPSGQDVATLNHEIAALGPELLPLTSTAVFHARPLPAGTEPVPEGHWLRPVGGDWLVGHFADPFGRELAMVVNRNHERDRLMVVRVSANRLPVERFEVNTRRWCTMPTPRVGDEALVRLSLRPGDGALLRFSR